MSEPQPEPIIPAPEFTQVPDVPPAAPPVDRMIDHGSLTQKERRIGERLIEAGIFTVAAVSILAIFLIFLFVFREASPIFFGGSDEEETKAVTAPAPNSGGLATAADTMTGNESDVYNPDATDISRADTNASGSSDVSLRDTTSSGSESDVYNPETGSIPGDADSNGGDRTIASAPPAPPDTTGSAAATAASELASAREIVGFDYPILEHDSPVEPSHLFHDVWQPNSDHPRYGIYSILIGTAKTTFVALLIATPLAILAALYTAFFAPVWVREYLKPVIEVLAGFPSVVLGFFCLMTVASVVQSVFGNPVRLNSVVGGIGLSLAVIPIIYTIADDALRSVPKSLREAALALGATEWEAAYQVMLPAATPGIFAAILLGLGRAFGETMIALMATGNAGTMGWDFFESVRTFAATIGAEMGEVVVGSPHYQVLFLLGVILFIFSFIINFVTEFYVKQRLIKRFRGSE